MTIQFVAKKSHHEKKNILRDYMRGCRVLNRAVIVAEDEIYNGLKQLD